MHLEARLAEPDVVISLTGHGPDGTGQRRMATVLVSNKGTTVAREVECGLALDGKEYQAGNGGIPSRLPALGPGEEVRWGVLVNESTLAELRIGQRRIEDAMTPWVRFTDKLGNRHEWFAS